MGRRRNNGPTIKHSPVAFINSKLALEADGATSCDHEIPALPDGITHSRSIVAHDQFATNMTLASARTTLDDKVAAWLSPSGRDIETSLSRKRPDLGYRALLTS